MVKDSVNVEYMWINEVFEAHCVFVIQYVVNGHQVMRVESPGADQ